MSQVEGEEEEEENEASLSLPCGRQKYISNYFPLPNIRPDPNCRPGGDQGSKLISDQDLFTDHLGLFSKF